ncbi:rhodanese-like domain-containing protein [Actinokineospora globicatena]|uniref:Sulfurtransferase n=1 Tax=Actinokineospora globicatena TaxID=103729 RepID=A0A9W6QLV6_9PSEU|nr:rhodanese-like domain-containing protein [Actinokineospora globicatena]MCP2301182.1 Rhodanese-related sulfurtransferase [Actinokineospora globicatena]GLW77182.1 sulfurtransferase [Actinokineospora globicatena]GLW84016.1 sulfurtransferase [Actinokineospora globicatena]GLW92040.1 sulfurtransferase [Actinokineospora globicatena]
MPNSVPAATVDAVPADATLLDVREQDEWDAGHAPTARHIPMGELVARLGELPADGEVYVICRSGGRSARVTQYLNGNGWDAVNVDGGMQAWAALGQPVVSETGLEPQVI